MAADTSPTALLESVKCYACAPPGFWPLFELALLQLIISGGSISGSQIYEYTPPGPPGFNPADVSKAAIAYDPAGIAASYNWDITGGIWV